jgi:1-acyl-sn-glycerol-3-phosphate acyltransferase
MPLPPRWLRRLVIAPVVLAMCLALLVTMPLWLLLATLGAPFGTGRLRLLRVLWVVTVYLAIEAAMLLVLLGLWLAAGAGWKVRTPAFQRAHYVLVGRMLRVLFAQARWALRLRLDVVGPHPDIAAPGRPELVLSRHAGPGDSFIVTHALVNWYDREPRIVLKNTLQWDPVVDILLNRLPNRFLSPGGPHPSGMSLEDQIGALATGLDSDDVLLIFPEGGNFTQRRRQRAIERLRRLGLREWAARAERMRHVLAPQPGGVLAALDAAPEAGIVLVGHTGFEQLDSVIDIWRGLPLDRRLTLRWWSVRPDEVPAGREERIAWLFDWWARIDAWIAERNAADRKLPGSGVDPEPAPEAR